MTEYEYEYYSVWKYRLNTNIIWFEEITRIYLKPCFTPWNVYIPFFHQLNWFFQNYCMTAKSSNIFLCPKKLLEKSKDKLWISINRNFSEQSVEKKKKKKLTDYRIEGMKRKNKKNKEKRLTKRSKRSTELWNVNFYKSVTQNFTPIKVRK